MLLPLGLTHAERTLEFRDTADMLLWASWFFRYHKDVTVRKIDIQYNIVNHRLYLTALRPGNWVMDGTEEFTPNVRV